MILPFHLTWNLQMPRGQKTGIFVLFGSGFVCITFATLRVIKLGVDGTGKTKMPEPKWMLLWTVLETSMGKSYSSVTGNEGLQYFNPGLQKHERQLVSISA
jgi:hypothetical protein